MRVSLFWSSFIWLFCYQKDLITTSFLPHLPSVFLKRFMSGVFPKKLSHCPKICIVPQEPEIQYKTYLTQSRFSLVGFKLMLQLSGFIKIHMYVRQQNHADLRLSLSVLVLFFCYILEETDWPLLTHSPLSGLEMCLLTVTPLFFSPQLDAFFSSFLPTYPSDANLLGKNTHRHPGASARQQPSERVIVCHTHTRLKGE